MALTDRKPATPAAQQKRKEETLTRGAPSVTRRISDAIVIKEGNPFFLSLPSGDVPIEEGHGFGFYYNDCRYLNGYEFRLAGEKPNSLVANADRGYQGIFELTNPDISASGNRATITAETIGIQLLRTMHGSRLLLNDVFNFQNFSLQKISFPISFRFNADFEDVFAVRELVKEHPGQQHPPQWKAGALTFRYDGADEISRSFTIYFDRPPVSMEEATAHFEIELESRGRQTLSLCILLNEQRSIRQPIKKRNAPENLHRMTADMEPSFEEWRRKHTHVDSDSLFLREILNRSMRDLRTLRSSIEDRSFFAAGVPWFSTLFGRDSLITSLQTLAYNPELAAETLRLLAEYQGTKLDDWKDEQPGKILHELRIGELAKTNRIPHSPYYGSIDSTPLFLILLGLYAQWTADLNLFHELRSNVEQALRWIEKYGDIDGDGYVEYQSTSEKGLVNQGWKDSGDALVNKDGSLARPPIALVELQGYIYMSKLLMADLFKRDGDPQRAEQLTNESNRLRERFNQDFWMEEEGIYAIALEENKEQVTIVSSNPGHALWSGIADAQKAERTVQRLMAPDMFNGWGIRTLSENEVRYNPIGYHLGTVWPHDNSMIAAGFKRYGQNKEARAIVGGIVAAAMEFLSYRLPELFAGFDRKGYEVPVHYPVACHPQAWAAGSVPYMISSLLGLQPNAFEKSLRIVQPVLPPFVHWLKLHGLRVGEAQVDLRFGLADKNGRAKVEVLNVSGDLNVEVDDSSSD